MVEMLFRVESQPLKRKEFVDFIEYDARVSRDTKQEPGTLWFDYYEDPKDADAFFVMEAYRDCAAFALHQSHEPYKRWESWIMPNVLKSFQPLYENGLTAYLPARLSSHDQNDLKDLNEQLAVMEQQRDKEAKAWFDTILSNQLAFRRATGVLVDRQAFLKSLDDPNPFDARETEGINLVGLEDGRALVILTVWTRKADNSENRYRNIRLFSKANQSWRLERWYNYDITGL